MPILGSFGTANDKAFGFNDGSVYDYRVLPPSITQNAALIYDASNEASYSGTGTTWYDLSDNGINATFSSTPTLSGTGGNKSLKIPNSGAITLTIPNVYTVAANNAQFVYVMVMKMGGTDTASYSNFFNALGWKSGRFLFDHEFLFDSDSEGAGGFGSTNKVGTPPMSSITSQYAIVYVEIDLQNGSSGVNTYRNNDDVHFEAGMTHSFSGGTSGVTVGNAGAEADIKFISLYPKASAPTQLQVYNALKTRFGL